VASFPEAGAVGRENFEGICRPLLPWLGFAARVAVAEMNRIWGLSAVAPAVAGLVALMAIRENMVLKVVEM
jgi:hypothetical protein